jgi:hypothetical protein
LGAGDCRILTGANNVKAEGNPVARHLSDVSMNNCNTVGKLITNSSAPNGSIVDNKQPCNNPPKRSEDLDKLEAIKKDLENNSFNANHLDQYVDFKGTNEGLQQGIDSLRPSEDSWAITKGAAGAGRATLSFLKDMTLGMGQLTYSVAKRASPVTVEQDKVSAMILAENIRLGNVCAELIEQQAKAVGKAIVKPITDPWAKGDYSEAVTRGVLEVGSLAVAFLDLAKAGEVASVTSKVSEAEKVAETTNVASKVGEGEKIAEVEKVGDGVKIIARKFDFKNYKMAEGEKLGDFGENVVKDKLKSEGYDTFYRVQNKSGNGVDIVAKNSKTGAITIAEVKSTKQEKLFGKELPLSKDQAKGGKNFSESRLNRAANEEDGYTDGISSEQAKNALKSIRKANKTGANVTYKKYDVYVDSNGRLIDNPKEYNW